MHMYFMNLSAVKIFPRDCKIYLNVAQNAKYLPGYLTPLDLIHNKLLLAIVPDKILMPP